MKFQPTPIVGAYVVEVEARVDARGSFARAFCRDEFAAQGLRLDVVQCNLARTTRAGTVRGLHYQPSPHDEQKLVRCVVGAVFDAIVDMRPDSPSFRRVFAVRLEADRQNALFVPAGVAHGYQALVDGCEFLYMTDRAYVAGVERGVRYSDPALGIEWPLAPRDVNPRDEQWPLLGAG